MSQRNASGREFRLEEEVGFPRFAFVRVRPISGQHESLPFEARVLRIEDYADRKRGDSEVVKHLSPFVVRDPIDCLRVHDQLFLHYEVRNVLSDQFPFIQDAMSLLLGVRNAAQAKLHAQAILINLLMQSMSANVENLDGAANNPIDFFL